MGKDIYPSKETAIAVFDELFNILIKDEAVNAKMRKANLDVRIVHKNPDFELYLSPDEVIIDSPTKINAKISIKMSCNTADSLWRGYLVMLIALALGKIRIKGSVPICYLVLYHQD